MTYEEMNEALQRAETTMNICDSVSTKIARLLVGRLHKVNGGSVLRALKAELTHYDSRTGRWKP